LHRSPDNFGQTRIPATEIFFCRGAYLIYLHDMELKCGRELNTKKINLCLHAKSE
jgi:hypothetical protein